MKSDGYEKFDPDQRPDEGRSLKQKCVFGVVLTVVIAGLATIIALAATGTFSSSNNHHKHKCRKKWTLMVSLDGFRADYLTDDYQTKWNISTPHLDDIIADGVFATQMRPVFPSLTFPNHYTLATGRYPGGHGIVANSFFDRSLNDTFHMSTDDPLGDWYRATPLWNTVREFGNDKYDLQSAVIFWVGSGNNCSGQGYPDYYLSFNASYTFQHRINKLIDLMDDEDEDYHLYMLYFDEPDHTCHNYGPQSPETAAKVEVMDSYIGELMSRLKEKGYDKHTDVIVVSDHGHAQTPASLHIELNSSVLNPFADSPYYYVSSFSPLFLLYITKEGRENKWTEQKVIDMFIESMVDDSQRDLFDIWTDGKVPYTYNGGYNDRIGDVVAMPKNGASFAWLGINSTEHYQYWLHMNGQHGYNNSAYDMQALFAAKGPSFKKGYVKDLMYNLDVYPLVCHLTCDMNPGPHNGSLENVKDFLR